MEMQKLGLRELSADDRASLDAAAERRGVTYPLMAPPHTELEVPVSRHFAERQHLLFGRFPISLDRIFLVMPVFITILVVSLIAVVPALQEVWYTPHPARHL